MKILHQITLVITVVFTAISGCLTSVSANNNLNRPNFIIILTDDQGFEDLSCYGSIRVETPHIDKMAENGLRFTNFYAQTVCGPSRAALLTGSYPIRIGEPGNKKHQHTILHPEEVTLAEQLKKQGYATACIGKWHLGQGDKNSPNGWNSSTMPNKQGFDYFYGTPLFNGVTTYVTQSKFRSQILRNEQVVVEAVESWDNITGDCTKEALNWLKENKEKPFFLYLAHSMPHVPLGAGPDFKGKNPGDPYADAIEELDWSIGQILNYLKETGLDKNTLVFFLSDNGPWYETTHGNKPGAEEFIPEGHSGSADPLRGYKMLSWEGGPRVPAIAQWTGKIEGGKIVDDIITSMDFYPTFTLLAGGKLNKKVKRDGLNITKVLMNPEETHVEKRTYYYYVYTHLQAVRQGKWKLVLPRPEYPEWTGFAGRFYGDNVDEIELYNLETDISETNDVAVSNPKIVKQMMKLIEKGRKELGDYNYIGSEARFFEDMPKRPDVEKWQTSDEQSRFDKKAAIDPPVTYYGENLTTLDFPVGAVGGSVIRMNGKAERQWWQIFNNFKERAGSGVVPNSFFAIRAKTNGSTHVKMLQTSSEGPFSAMDSLTFQGEYPFGWYNFWDDKLPLEVTLEAYNPLIPMDLKNSAIPSGIFSVKVKNTSKDKIEINLLATQQNAVGFTGYDTITGPNNRQVKGYGQNKNTIVADANKTSLQMTGGNGSMQLSAYAEEVSYAASWNDLTSLFKDFSEDGKLTGRMEASSPAAETTVDGALATGFSLKPGEEKTVTFVLSWHFPGGSFGRKDSDWYSRSDRDWYFPKAGSYYENWWTNASDVDRYVQENFEYLDLTTRLYHETLYSSTIPRYVLDRISSNISVLKSPTCFWTKDGYFGIWESTSNEPLWLGNCKHVIHYAQGHARLFPELGRILRNIDLNTQTSEGLLPARDGQLLNAMDGHFGTILGVYREHVLSTDNDFLTAAWPRTKKAMDYVIINYDSDRDGMLSGTYHNTLDCNSSGTSPWIGSLYIAALKASAQMALLMGEKELSAEYGNLANTAAKNQNQELWSEELGYYIAKPEYLPDTRLMDKACGLDMLLGQWWANQLNLGRIYPLERSLRGLNAIYRINRFTEDGSQRPYRDFLGNGDTGWQMFVHPDTVPKNSIHYYCETMSGFEYAAAATMIQHGMVEQGLEIIKEISKRYDGRLRAEGEVTLASNATVFGTGSPFGEDECGDYYARAMSSWSALLALQGFIYDGPKQTIGFKPTWQPEDHASFFTTSTAWGLFTQTQRELTQTANIELKYGTALIKNIVLAAPNKKTVNNITVKLDGAEQTIEKSEQDGNTITINLKSVSKLNAASALTVSFNLKSKE